MSQLRVFLSSECAKSLCWPWLSPLYGWGSLTTALTAKFVYIAHHFILVRINHFRVRLDRMGWWFGHSVS